MILKSPTGHSLTSDASAEDVAVALREIAATTRNPHMARAAALVVAKRGGRPSIDDAGAIAEIGWLLDQGNADTIKTAARLVALTMGGQSVDATTIRLARKFRKRNV